MNDNVNIPRDKKTMIYSDTLHLRIAIYYIEYEKQVSSPLLLWTWICR